MRPAALVLVPALAAAGCGRAHAPSVPGRRATVVQSSVSLGDPHIVSDSTNRLSILFSIYEPLVAVDDAGAFTPSQAERWTVSDDARTWTFTLRKGVYFHNGDTLTAPLEDLVSEGKRAEAPEKAAAAQALEKKIQEVLSSPNHRWYLNKLDPEELKERQQRQQEFQKRYSK